MGKVYQVSGELLLYTMQLMRPLIENVEGFDKHIKRFEDLMAEQDRAQPSLRAGVQEILDVLESMGELMKAKGHDYSGSQHTFTSFERAAYFAGVDPAVAFNILIGVKISRLTSLRDRDPYNESLMDSYLDMASYLVLFLAYQKFREKTT